MAPLLELTAPDRIGSGTPVRCRDTIAPLAELSGLPVKIDAVFDEGSPDGIEGAAAAVRALAADGGSTVVCSQGKVIPPLLRRLDPADATTVEDFATPKGTGWLVAFAGTTAIGADRLVP